MSQNPFFVGQPVSDERFIGRESELNTAFDQILNSCHLAIWGSPGIGKSSFLEQLASPLVWQLRGHDHSKAVIVLFSCLSIHPFSATSFWEKIFTLSKDELDDEPELQSYIETVLSAGQPTMDSVRRLLRKLGKQSKFLLLLVDDYDSALRPNEEYKEDNITDFVFNCRTLAYHCRERKYLSMVVSSFRRLDEVNPSIQDQQSPWYNHYLFQPLKSFSEIEVAALLGGMPMTSTLKDGIREIADGNPALLQIAGFLLYQELRTGKNPNVETFARNFESRTRHFFQDTWTMCNEEEQILLMLIALLGLEGRLTNKRYTLKGIENVFSYRERDLIDLEERGIVISGQKEGKTIYSFSSSIMEWWVIQEIGNSDESELEKRRKVFLKLISKEQVETITNTIHWLWQHKEDIPSILEWIGKIAAALPKGAIS